MLGASGLQTFFRVTLPNIKWGVLYGVILCNARAMGEFGAVSVVSGHIRGAHQHAAAAGRDSLQRVQLSGGVRRGVAAGAAGARDARAQDALRAASARDQSMSIEVQNVSKRFGDFDALKNVSFSVPAGELVALLGPSGGGKTTMLRIIAGLGGGRFRHGAARGRGRDRSQRARARRRLRVPALRALPPHDGVRERRVRPAGAAARRASAEEIDRKVRELLDLVQLDFLADRLPSQLSGGQRQRVGAGARAGRRAEGAAARRAVRRARRQGPPRSCAGGCGGSTTRST